MKSKIIAIWMCAMLALSGAVVMAGNGAEAASIGEKPMFSGTGSGTILDPYVITNVSLLQEMSLDIGANYTLGNDINAMATSGWNSGAGFNPVGNFSGAFNGTLDGLGFTISNLYIDRPGEDNAGLFGRVSGNASLVNVTLEDADITGGNNTGGLVGNHTGKWLINCHVVGDVAGKNYTGGVGGNVTANVTYCTADANVAGWKTVGGMFGAFGESLMDNCTVWGDVTSPNTQDKTMGGLIGLLRGEGEVERSSSHAYVHSDWNTNMGRMGGAIGWMTRYTEARQCRATGDIYGTYTVGGFVGGTANANITDCYATGRVDGFNGVGGFIGVSGTGATPYDRIFNCYYGGYIPGAMSGTYDKAGICGSNNTAVYSGCYWDTEVGATTNGCERTVDADPAGMYGRTTFQMMQQATFVGWDFTNIWDIKEGYAYPFFAWDQFNSAPIAEDDTFTTDEDTILATGNVTEDNGNGPDVDPDGDAIAVAEVDGNPANVGIAISLPSGATLNLSANGSFTYDPDGAFDYLANGDSGADSFTYTITDGNGTSGNAAVTININGLNDAPAISDAGGSVAFNEDGLAVIIDSDIAVSDADDADLTGAWINITNNYQQNWDQLEFPGYAGISGAFSIINPSLGSMELTGTDTVANYVQALRMINFNNTASNPNTNDRTISWQVTDGESSSIAVTSTVTISDVNDMPLAVNDTGAGFTTDEDSAFDTTDVTINDTDPELDTLAVSDLNATGIIGVATNNLNNTFNYDPDGQFEYLGSGESALDFFNYTVSDGNGGTDVGMVTITVNGVNDAPVLGAIGNRIVNEENALTFTATATDPENDGLTFSLEAGYPSGASIDPTTGDFSWTPTEAQGPGIYIMTIRGTDDGTPNQYDNETISVTVGEANLAPVLDPIGNRNAGEETLLSFKAWANDTDNPANTLTFSLDAGAPAGAAIDPVTGDLTWTPTEAQGPNTYFMTIRVTDDGTPALDDSETIQITVNEVNIAPVLSAIGNRVVNELAMLTFTAAASDADLPANTLTFTIQGTPPTGASITSGGMFSWTPTEAQGPGFYNVTVRVSDGALFDEETFMVTVGEVNSPPTAVDDSASLAEDSGANIINVLANDLDTDLPANTLTVTAVTQGAHGTVTMSGGALEYTPSADFSGTDTFTYSVSDGEFNDTATVTITVTSVNDDPSAADDAITVTEDSGANAISVLANDGFSPDAGETLTITSTTQGAHGTVAITAGGTQLTYMPDANFHGTDTFTYTVSDGNGGTATATVTVTVTNVNDDPVITTANVISAMGGDDYIVDYAATDIDGDTLTWTLVTTADWLAIDSSTGVLNGTAVAGTFSVQVTVSDGNGGTDNSYFTLTVTQKDSDSDGVPDTSDAFPEDPNESVDTDGDGTGNNADTDDDGDGAPDSEDAFPLDPAETLDTDGDGIGNNADTDDDGDGVADTEDPEPLNPAITGNEYDGGWIYWNVVISIMVALLIALICLGIVWYLTRKR